MFPHLLPYLADNNKAGDYFEAHRWPNGVVCPYCQGQEIEKRERSENGLQRYSCLLCAQAQGQQYRMFTVWSESIYEKSKLSPSLWLWVIAFWQMKLNSTEIGLAVGVNEQSAARCVNLLDGSVYESHHLDPDRQLKGQVEADECYQTAGHKGQPRRVAQEQRSARQRGLKRRGRATAAQGRPPILGLVQRPDEADQTGAQVYLEVLPNVQTDTIKPIILAKIHPESQLLTDEYATTSLPKPAMTIALSITARVSMFALTPMALWSIVIPWKGSGPAYGLFCVVLLASAKNTCICGWLVMSSYTTIVISTSLTSFSPLYNIPLRPPLAIGGRWLRNIVVSL